MTAHEAPFTASNRIWIGGYQNFQTDISDYDALLTSLAHRWDSGWGQIALAALAADSVNFHG